MTNFWRRNKSQFLIFCSLPVFLFNVFFLCGDAYGADTDPGLKFIENKNQWPGNVHFLATIPGGNMTIGPGKFSYYFVDGKRLRELHEQAHHVGAPDADMNWNIKHHSVQAEFIGSNSSVPLPFGKSTEYYNYYLGNDETKWASKAYAYQGVIYPSFYNGVDLKVYSSGNHLKYDFIVAPSGDPSQIVVEYQGMDHLKLDNGNLILKSSLAEIIEQRPFAYQFINGEKIVVNSEYSLTGNRLSFCFPEGYDACYELVIDPLLIFSTYSGFTADNWGSTATPGEHGTLYSSGVTSTLNGGNFSSTPGAYQTSYGGEYDIGIYKYDSTGSSLLYATLLGGVESESPHSLVMNKDEELIVLGTTSSSDFPTTNGAYDRSYNLGTFADPVVSYSYNEGSDIFVARLSKDGTQLKASTFLGGSQNDGLNSRASLLVRNYGDQLRGDVITDAEGNIYISSVTASSDFFPVTFTAGYDLTHNGGGTDAILVKLKADLSQIIWGTYLGGSEVDASHTLKLDSQGNVFIAGGTASADFPMVSGYKTIYGGQADGWIAKVDPTGMTLLRSTFTGTTFFDQIYFIDINANDEVYAYGQTAGGHVFQITPADVYRNPNSGQFIQKFSSTLSSLVFSTVFGSGSGIPDISPTAFLVNDCNNLYMAGWGGDVNIRNNFWNNNTVGMPVSADAIQKTSSGSDFYFMVLTDNATRFLYGTYLGGNDSKTHVDGGTSRFDKSGIVYHAVCSGCGAYNDTGHSTSDFPTTQGAWSRLNRSTNCNNAAFKFDLSSLRAVLQTNTVDLQSPGIKIVCLPDPLVLQNMSIGGEIFEWDMGDGTTLTLTDTAYFSHAYAAPGQYLVKLKAIDQGTCKNIDSTQTLINVYKAEIEVQDDDALCEGDPYTLKSSGGVFYEWQSADNSFTSNLAHPQVSPPDTTEYYITITEASGCVRRDSVQLNVIPSMVPDFNIRRVGGCEGRAALEIVNLTDSVKTSDTMVFDWGDGTTTEQIGDIHNYEKDGVYRVKLTTTREFCVYEKVVDMPMFSVTLPNVITPGAPEGKNDTFTVQYGEIQGATPGDYGFRVDLTLYNRWGRILLQLNDYQYDWSGADLTSGIYYYEVTIQDHTTCKSWLHLMR